VRPSDETPILVGTEQAAKRCSDWPDKMKSNSVEHETQADGDKVDRVLG